MGPRRKRGLTTPSWPRARDWRCRHHEQCRAWAGAPLFTVSALSLIALACWYQIGTTAYRGKCFFHNASRHFCNPSFVPPPAVAHAQLMTLLAAEHSLRTGQCTGAEPSLGDAGCHKGSKVFRGFFLARCSVVRPEK